MNSTRSICMQSLEKGIQALNEKKFDRAVKCSLLGLDSKPLPIEKYSLMYCLVSAQASQFFFAKKYQQSLKCFSEGIKNLEMEAQLLKLKFMNMSPEDDKYGEVKILFESCSLSIGLLYARRGQVHYFLSLGDKAVQVKESELADLDFVQAGLFQMNDFAFKLNEITKYVVKHLNTLSESLDKKNDVSLFICAEHYWEGLAFFKKREFKEAIIQFKEGLKYCPYDANLWENLARTELASSSLCTSVDETISLMASIVDHTTQATEYRHHSTIYLMRGIANSMRNEFKLSYDDFKFVMRREIYSKDESEEELKPIFENAVRSFCSSQLQLVKSHRLSPVFLAEEKNLQEKLNKDDYRGAHIILTKLAAACEQNEDFGIAENNYSALLWMAIKLNLSEFISPSAASYLSCVLRRLKKDVSELTLNDIDNVKHLCSLLSKNKLALMKSALNSFTHELVQYAQKISHLNPGPAKEFYLFAQMLTQENSEIYKLASQQLKILNGARHEEKQTTKIRKKKAKEKFNEITIVSEPKSVDNILEEKNVQEVLIVKVASAQEKIITKQEEIKATPPVNCSIETTDELKLAEPIKFHPAVWALSYCMQDAGIKQVYVTGESFCTSLFSENFIPQIEMVFGAINPRDALQRAFPQKTIQAEGYCYKIVMHEEYVVNFRNSEAMNKIADMLEQNDLPLKKINSMKRQARQEDAKNRNDFTVLALYGECVDGSIVSYDPTPNQRAYADLRKKRMKCIRETDKTLAEDPSVALQAIYYAGVWSLTIPETITKAFVNMKSVDLDQACVRMPGRINDWFGKLFLNGSSAKNFENLRQLKVLEKFIPEFKLISEDICEERAILLRYLQNMFECCDVIANEKSPEHKPDFNLIYATFSYAAQLLKEHGFVDQTKISTCSAALFKHSFATISQEKQRKLLLAAENNWKFNFSYR